MSDDSTELHRDSVSSGVHISRTRAYSNPVHPGDLPDPSVARCGDAYYAFTTSTEWAPLFPILRSTDLVNWTEVGAVFSARPPWAAGQFWAPAIHARADGTFALYYTARRRGGPLTIAVATAPHPEGPWHDHGPLVGQDDGSIDATIVDDGGATWMVWKSDGNALGRPTMLWAQQLRADGLALEGECYELIRNDAAWEGDVVEGPSILARDGWLYLFYSGNTCCGPECRYAVGVARARTIAGPWEKCPRNPVLAANASFRGPGHGDVVRAHDGRSFYLYHAYAERTGAPALGRQLMLDEIAWDTDGWPSINDGRGPSSRAPMPFGERRRRGARTPASPWQWPHGSPPVLIADDAGGVIIEAPRGGRGRDPLATALARRTHALDYTAISSVATASLAPHALASLGAYGDHQSAVGIGVRDGNVVAWRRRRSHWQETVLGPAAPTTHLRLESVWGSAYRVAYSGDGVRWCLHPDVLDGRMVPPWDRGVRVALTIGGASGARAHFGPLHMHATPPAVERMPRVRPRVPLAPAVTPAAQVSS